MGEEPPLPWHGGGVDLEAVPLLSDAGAVEIDGIAGGADAAASLEIDVPRLDVRPPAAVFKIQGVVRRRVENRSGERHERHIRRPRQDRVER